MATIHMAVKTMPRKMHKSRLLVLIAIFVFFVFPSFVFAVGYGDRVYNYGLYSTNTPSGGNTLILSIPPPSSVVVTNGCTATTLFSSIDGQRCPVTTAPTKTTYNFGPTTLKIGSTGAGVKELQRFFNNTLNINLVIDGKLGKKTIAVVKKWQKDNGLVADSLVGKKTKAKMNAMAK